MLRTASALVLLAALLAGCGNDDDSAGGESQESSGDFCTEYGKLMTSVMEADPKDVDAGVEATKGWAEQMQDIEPPADMPDDAQQGLEAILTEIDGLDPDATQEEFESLGDDLDQAAREDIDAFGSWAIKGCPEAFEGLMGELEGQGGGG